MLLPGANSPSPSWTRGSMSTPDCCHERRKAFRSTNVRLQPKGALPDPERSRKWNYYTHDAQDWTSTRHR